MTDRSHAATRRSWIDRIDRFQQSSQTVAQFCAAEGFSPASFYRWRRMLQADTPSSSPSLPRFIPVSLPPNRQAELSPPTETVTMMSVELPGGVRIRFEATGPTSVRS
ncbi:hypothetical protein K227x_27760 [Rubripirellula lacrimiformis]|uniref:Transposase n=1 Tax=Rubripirellula lacrimiformis TaxID=1930273 RepID=A0A517NAT2_9BACT|nr:hypothetical protein [Rubripirellula lacrimiformis]QDT04244.1 hypothetical protein K227x_26340 [Rubripirellula lacrimiformis]QDT04385.1 hypothetical protein K227x_27760 [Rubripirellula lacrimiformis]